MSFIPAHSAVVKAAFETSSITESTDGIALPTIGAAPTTAIIGYTNLPQNARGLNNSKGFAIGYNGAAYNKRGRVEPSITLEIRVTSNAAIELFLPDADTGVLPSLCVQVLVADQSTDTYRYCKPGDISFRFTSGEEIVIKVTLQAIAHVYTSGATFNPAALLALGTPMMWHDVRSFTLQGAAVGGTPATPVEYRRAVQSLDVAINYNLERKNERPNFGDNVPLSRTSYALLEHHTAVSGTLTLHERANPNLFHGAANSLEWGNMVLYASNADTTGTQGFTLTILRALPTDESMQGGESSAEIDFSIPFVASNILFEADA